jgi:triosephosphate isomerase
MTNKIVMANWKMNPTTTSQAKKIFTGIKKGATKIKDVDVYVCPPFVFLPELAKLPQSKKVVLGTQDAFYEETGAYTGQISPKMLKSFKTKAVILGHSERRLLGEDNSLVARKVKHVIESGMTAVLCIGEKERNEEGDYYTFIRDEISSVLSGIRRIDLKKLIIAYEPIWAIGKRAEEAISVSDLYEMILFIRKVVTEHFGRAPAQRLPILYGGSVKKDNAKEFVNEGGADGLLVGGASLKPSEFVGIIKEVSSK